jgi:hypothetical protein
LLSALIVALAVHGFDASARTGPGLDETAAIVVSVVDDAGVPVPDARVLLTGRSLPLHRVAASDERGGATFSDLPAGSYIVAAEKPGHVKAVFGQHGVIDETVIVVDDKESFAARIALVRTGSISGIIANSRGDAAQALVQLHQLGRTQGRRTLKLLAATRSDPQGSYRLDDVAPGDYLISASAETSPVFFPGVNEPSLAAPVRVVAGNPTAGIRITVSSAPLARVEGQVLNVDGQPAAGAVVHITRSDELDPGGSIVRANDAGEFRANVTPGAYRITAETGARADVAAVSGVSTPITLRDVRPARISGRVELAGAGDRTLQGELAGGVVATLRARGQPFPIVSLVVDGNTRAFRPLRIAAGAYVLDTSAPALSNWSVESIVVNNRPSVDHVVRVEPDEQVAIVVTLGRGSTHLSGTVIDGRQHARYDHQILVFPVEPAQWIADSGRVRVLQPDTKGRFEIRDLPPGDYLLAAIAGFTGNWDPPLLEAAAPAGLRVHLQRDTAVVQNVMIAK